MADSLALDEKALRTEISRFLGYGALLALTADQAADVERVLRSGYRQFLFAHQWSFIKPVKTIVTVGGQEDYELAEDFNGIDGRITFAPQEAYHTIALMGEAHIRAKRQREYAAGAYTGRPLEAAVRPKVQLTGDRQRFELMLWPKPDGPYTLTFRYNVSPIPLSPTHTIPLGGPVHAETLLEACLAVAERRYNDEEGPHAREYQRLLVQSIEQDQRLVRPEVLGYNGDRTEEVERRYPRSRNVTFEGVLYP